MDSKKDISIYSNGIKIRKKNTSILITEESDSVELNFARYIGENAVTAQVFNNRGVAVLKFHLNKETMHEIASAWIQYLINKDERDTNLPEQTQ